MKKRKTLSAFLMLAVVLPAAAAIRTVTLKIPSMTCPACPITVKKALKAVGGVSKVDVNYAKKDVVVTYDDAKTNVPALTKVTANAGYPSTPETEVK